MCAAFCFFFANLSFYLIMTIFMQKALGIPPLDAGMVFMPLTLTFVIASRYCRRARETSRHAGADRRLRHPDRRTCGAWRSSIAIVEAPTALLIALVLAIFGFGQGLVMAPLSSVVLSTVKPARAGAGSGMYGTTAQIAQCRRRRRHRRGVLCDRSADLVANRDVCRR